jgi:hypothetical protein
VLWDNGRRVDDTRYISLADYRGKVVVLIFIRIEGWYGPPSVPVPALQRLWSLCRDSHQVQFIAVVVHATRPPIEDPQTFANAQSHITDFNATHGYSPEQVRLFDLTQAEYPIVWRNEGDWDGYVGAYFKLAYYDRETGQLRRREEPDLPGIAIIDLTHVPLPQMPRKPGTTSGGIISALRFGFGEIVGHDLRRNGRLQGFSNLKATSLWVDREICRLLGKPLTFTSSYLISQKLSGLRRVIRDAISDRYGEELQQAIEKYLLAYLQKGVKPPATIAPAILNMADDYLSNETLDLRPGDHFAIQNYLRRKKAATKGKPKS